MAVSVCSNWSVGKLLKLASKTKTHKAKTVSDCRRAVWVDTEALDDQNNFSLHLHKAHTFTKNKHKKWKSISNRFLCLLLVSVQSFSARALSRGSLSDCLSARRSFSILHLISCFSCSSPSHLTSSFHSRHKLAITIFTFAVPFLHFYPKTFEASFFFALTHSKRCKSRAAISFLFYHFRRLMQWVAAAAATATDKDNGHLSFSPMGVWASSAAAFSYTHHAAQKVIERGIFLFQFPSLSLSLSLSSVNIWVNLFSANNRQASAASAVHTNPNKDKWERERRVLLAGEKRTDGNALKGKKERKMFMYSKMVADSNCQNWVEEEQ